ncbi:MAG: plasmid mobilization protein [Prevotella sp.]
MEKTKEIAGRIQGSELIEKVSPEKGFFIKTRERYISSMDGKEHSRFKFEPVKICDIFVDKIADKCKIHFIVHRADGSVNQVDQPISRPRYDLFVGYKLDANRIGLLEKILHENRTGLCIRRHAATKLLHVKVTQMLWNELIDNAKKCGQNLSQYCITLLRGKQPRAAFSEEELELLQNLKKARSDVQLMFNAMVAEFSKIPETERLRAVINDRSFDWWRDHLITALEFFDKMREKVLKKQP